MSRPEERLLQPSTPYASCDIRLAPDTTSRVVTVTAPYVPSRYGERPEHSFSGGRLYPERLASADKKQKWNLSYNSFFPNAAQPDLEAE